MTLRGRRWGRAAWWAVAGATAIAVAAAYLVRRHEQRSGDVVVSLTFDDGFASQWTARSILDDHDYKGTFYLNSARLGQPRRMNAAQVLLLAEEGHEIGGHTLDHVELPKHGPARRLRQICDDRVALARLVGDGAVRSFAYPYGASKPEVERDVAACGYSSARIVGGLDPRVGDCDGCPDAESTSPGDPFRVRSSPSFVASTPVAQATRQIAAARESGGGWVPLVFHEVCDGCSQLAIRPADFDALLDWMRAHDVSVRTVDQVVGGRARPAVVASAVGIAGALSEGDTWWPGVRWALLGVLVLLFGLPIGGLAVARATGRW